MNDRSYTCPWCGIVSYSIFDRDEEFCGACHKYAGDVDPSAPIRLTPCLTPQPPNVRCYRITVAGREHSVMSEFDHEMDGWHLSVSGDHRKPESAAVVAAHYLLAPAVPMALRGGVINPYTLHLFQREGGALPSDIAMYPDY